MHICLTICLHVSSSCSAAVASFAFCLPSHYFTHLPPLTTPPTFPLSLLHPPFPSHYFTHLPPLTTPPTFPLSLLHPPSLFPSHRHHGLQSSQQCKTSNSILLASSNCLTKRYMPSGNRFYTRCVCCVVCVCVCVVLCCVVLCCVVLCCVRGEGSVLP